MKNTIAKIGEKKTSPILIIFFANILFVILPNVLRFAQFVVEKIVKFQKHYEDLQRISFFNGEGYSKQTN